VSSSRITRCCQGSWRLSCSKMRSRAARCSGLACTGNLACCLASSRHNHHNQHYSRDAQAIHLVRHSLCFQKQKTRAPQVWRQGCWLLLTGVHSWETPVPLEMHLLDDLQAVRLAAHQVHIGHQLVKRLPIGAARWAIRNSLHLWRSWAPWYDWYFQRSWCPPTRTHC
jgi:hypothetical protein